MRVTIGKNVLLPADDKMREEIAKHAIGEELDVELLHPRNAAFNAKVFNTIARIAKAIKANEDDCRYILLVGTGRFTKMRFGSKEIMLLPSCNKKSMTAKELEQFWEDIPAFFERAIVPKISQEDANDIRQMFA